MTRYLYGNTPADYTLLPTGRIAPNVALTVWDDDGGTQVTDLLDYNGVACSTITSDDTGLVRFYGPDDVRATLWIQPVAGGTALAIRPVNLPAPDFTIGTVTTGTADVTLTPDGPDDYTMDLVLPTAGADGVNTAAIQDDAVTAAKIAPGAISADLLALVRAQATFDGGYPWTDRDPLIDVLLGDAPADAGSPTSTASQTIDGGTSL